MEVYDNDGSINCNTNYVLEHWKESFSTLLNTGVGVPDNLNFKDTVNDFVKLKEREMEDPLFESNVDMNKVISEEEVIKITKRLKLKKSKGIDEIPNEVLKCQGIVPLLVNLFNLCFDTGLIPTPWYQSIVHPLHKSPETDPRIPSHYRGISLISCVSKVFTAILAYRVSNFLQENGLLAEEQGGFRNGRSCIDQAFILHTVAKNSILKGRELLGCFIDFKKAFDGLDRMFLKYKLLKSGITGRMYNIIKSIYDPLKTQSCIRLNNNLTDWFETGRGVKQGDSLSPVLFLIFINDLAEELKSLNFGVNYFGQKIPILMYADDVVILSESNDELQKMLDFVYTWCNKWQMAVNMEKTKIVCFRKKDKARNSNVFKYGEKTVDYVKCYKYLGIYFDEHLDFEEHGSRLSTAGSRALGALISKMKMGECMTYESYSKCFHSCVLPIIEYGTEITGIYKMDNLDKVVDKAARAFLGVHKFCTIVSMYKDLGWVSNECKRKLNVLRYWNRLLLMSDTRLTKKVFNDMYNHPYRGSWCYYIKNVLRQLDMNDIYMEKQECDLQLCKDKLENAHNDTLLRFIDKKPKLRLYKQIMCKEGVEKYVKLNLSSAERSMVAQFRMGILPIRIETGRFTNLKITQRLCQICNDDKIEDEIHFIFHCPVYNLSRQEFYNSIENDIPNFQNMTDIGKLSLLSSKHIRKFAKYLLKIFHERKNCEYKDK